MLAHRSSPEVNVVTVEDPVEYELPGAVQVQINPRAGLTFATSLRSILRQDPDVILVGEIRDSETAHIALQAATTGHLVLSTLHTNDALSTIARLLDLKVDPGSLAQSLTLVLAQRLARRVCRACTATVPVPPELAARIGLRSDERCAKGAGCSSCSGTGYAGRVAVLEVLPVGRELKTAIQKGASEAELRRIAVQSGYVTLVEHGRTRIREGLTTPEEVARVLLLEQVTTCGECLEPVEPDYVVCPHCAAQLRLACKTCATPLKAQWRACPYCASPCGEHRRAFQQVLRGDGREAGGVAGSASARAS
jgi:type IV pilus assembly protein PilB